MQYKINNTICQLALLAHHLFTCSRYAVIPRPAQLHSTLLAPLQWTGGQIDCDRRAVPHTTVHRLLGDRYRLSYYWEPRHAAIGSQRKGKEEKEEERRLICPSARCWLIFLSVTLSKPSFHCCSFCTCAFLFHTKALLAYFYTEEEKTMPSFFIVSQQQSDLPQFRKCKTKVCSNI